MVDSLGQQVTGATRMSVVLSFDEDLSRCAADSAALNSGILAVTSDAILEGMLRVERTHRLS